MVLGSGRALLDDPAQLSTYRSADRPPLLLGNLGAAQVRRPDAPERAERLVAMLDADGLSVHLNPIQEAVQPEGEPDFAGVAAGIAAVVERLAPLPVVVKEVGFGMDAADVALLRDAGVAAIDVAGAGGTNWALVEGRRDERAGGVAAAFADWGVPTADALIEALATAPGLPVIASGGLRDGVDAAKALALGASAAGLARPFLLAAQADETSAVAATLIRQLRVAVWAVGAASVGDLSTDNLRA
jgi:isopentenyl-diphosphate delta-isomerase